MLATTTGFAPVLKAATQMPVRPAWVAAEVTVPLIAPPPTSAALMFGVVAPAAMVTTFAVSWIGWLLYHCIAKLDAIPPGQKLVA